MDYYSLDYDMDNFPKGYLAAKASGEMLAEENIEKIDTFWEYFKNFNLEGEPSSIPSFNYLIPYRHKKVNRPDYLGIYLSVGLLISNDFMKLISQFNLDNYISHNVTTKERNKFYNDYYYFTLLKRSYHCIDFEKSWFFFQKSDNNIFSYECDKNSLLQYKNVDELILAMNGLKSYPKAYELVISKNSVLDILDLFVLNPQINLFAFSERIVDEITKQKLSNINFKKVDRVC